MDIMLQGLDKDTQFLLDTMLPNIAPETAAKAAVTFDKVEFDMIKNLFTRKVKSRYSLSYLFSTMVVLQQLDLL